MIFRSKRKISTAIALITSILIMAATVGIALYALFFVDKIFTPLISIGDFSSEFELFRYSLTRIVLAFLVFSLIASYYLTKLIINPLIELAEGTKELSSGNFSHRFKKTKYDEINTLIETYNNMAENLQTLYQELELKVKERTKELQNANLELKATQVMMVHSEKMRSLGELVAGITHEINNPINFIYGNLVHLKNYSNSLIEIINLYEKFENNLSEAQKNELKAIKEKIELEFIKEDLPLLIKSCQEGTDRTKKIIVDLKNFSRIDEMVVNKIDLANEIDTTLNILHNKIKSNIEIVKDYTPNMPLIEGFGGQLNQVFMNILDNACYALRKQGGKIFIRLLKTENNAIIEIEDTGCGMNEEQKAKIFDPFFTTKPVGSGTGLGMSISYKVIQKHSGTIKIDTTEGKGTKFTIELPIKLKIENNQEQKNG